MTQGGIWTGRRERGRGSWERRAWPSAIDPRGRRKALVGHGGSGSGEGPDRSGDIEHGVFCKACGERGWGPLKTGEG